MHFAGIYQFRVAESSESGTPVGRIRAADKDVGENAEMYFTIVSGDGLDTFDIFTDKATQEGVITVSKVRLRPRSSLIAIVGISGATFHCCLNSHSPKICMHAIKGELNIWIFNIRFDVSARLKAFH